MKRLFLLFTLVVFALCANAQSVTKFLGIPVDGTEYAFKNKLKAKGFKDSKLIGGALEGEFNGEDVYVSVQTQGGKVQRVIVSDRDYRDEGQIRIRFNKLLDQFSRNEKYFTDYRNEYLVDSDDLSYEMSVNNKQFQAAFYQKANETSTLANSSYRLVWFAVTRNPLLGFGIAIYYENRLNEADGSDL